jgi:uncharacterized Zn-binding protein involved in type VI secretion
MAYAVREGDPTTSGGVVLRTSGEQVEGLGRLARMGDAVWCAACRQVGFVAQGNPTLVNEYIAVATEGHQVRCACTPGNNRLIATQQLLVADMEATINIPDDQAEQATLMVEHINQGIKQACQP